MVGASVFAHPTRQSGLLGTSAPVAYALAGLAAVSVAAGYAVFLSSPLGTDPGGGYLHVSRTWGSRLAGGLAAWLKLPAYVGLVAVVSLALGRRLATAAGLSVPVPVAGVAVLTALFVLHLTGVRRAGTVQVVLAGGFLLLLAVLLVAALSKVAPGNLLSPVPRDAFSDRPAVRLGTSTVFVLFSFVGLELLAQYAGETRDPRAVLPRTVLGGVGAVALLYLLVSAATLGAIHWVRFPFSTAPFADAAASALPVRTPTILALGTPLALVTTAVPAFAVPSRLLYSMGRDGSLPPAVAVVDRVTGMPVVGLGLTYAATAVIVLAGTVHYALYLVVAGLALSYAIHGLSVAALPFRRPSLYRTCRVRPPPAVLAAVGLVAAVAAGACAALALTAEPWRTLPLTQLAPTLRPYRPLLLREPRPSVLASLFGWLLAGAVVALVQRDYRAATDQRVPPMDAYREDAPADSSADDAGAAETGTESDDDTNAASGAGNAHTADPAGEVASEPNQPE
jgi:amino acid transporter